MDWIVWLGLLILLGMLVSAGSSSSGHSGSAGEERRAASKAAAGAVRHGAVEEVIRRRSAGELTEEDARALLAELLAGPRASGGQAQRPPRG
jgi:hypothetical protein